MDEIPNRSRGRVTLQQLAHELDLSTATVSLALRDSSVVAAATRDRVQEVARARGYVANRSAAALRTARTNIMGVGLHDIFHPASLELLAAVEERLALAGKSVLLGVSRESVAHQSRALCTLVEYRPDALILSPAASCTREDLEQIAVTGVPVVQAMREVDGGSFDFAGCNDHAGMMLAIRHLLGLGHRRIAMIGGGMAVSTSRRRRAGYIDGLKAAGLSVLPELVVDGNGQRDFGCEGMARLLALEEPPTAAVCCDDMLASGALLELRAAGLTAGQDFSLIGFDNVGDVGICYPPLTTIDARIAEYARIAAEFALARLETPERPVQRVELSPSLVVRSTAGPVVPVRRRCP
ncbi:LacI family DNA-binding transcriptional regulator [Xanthobacter sp. TB0139]|uniref:LacI family DNA-binding transcriptional regulator n=1 Tax=Xanthobacter sp. TB0139 TaxID=3459178 RepID=UPI00403928A7